MTFRLARLKKKPFRHQSSSDCFGRLPPNLARGPHETEFFISGPSRPHPRLTSLAFPPLPHPTNGGKQEKSGVEE
ncbi:hypothetical protein C0Q70_00809 [Pomacea canaliculata]|uniref:Uncharacterized protein n=1 Tax=Pomacea canaliculata TaxID=400727 RepID=A0A2T7PXR7_POMCA|nr:hypothetical protein C0Q70_00809 [Pomacea canaliculata]